MTLSIEDRKRKCLEYIREAKELQWSYERNAWGRQHWRMLQGASLVIMPHRHDELRPYAMLVMAVRRRFTIDEQHLNRVVLTDRQKYRAGMMTAEQKSRYESDCRWKRHRERDWDKAHQDNSLRGQELRRLAKLTLS